ncbi:universal stress protein [Teredinibacter franksiae]|jgi:Universal stress protein UspA and related nucleotide-binding proteins|uniref:universal stress protein n=1 Tax=Teredinibacter franksiae TaxID=2761453 RepID=UPI00162A81AE|nr:universal stress protein [Teredinibacter franksiae]
MTGYKHILVGLDLSTDCAQILNKAAEIANVCNADISIAHIVEPLAFAYGGDVPIDLTEAQALMEQQAKTRLAKIVDEVKLTPKDQFVGIGQAATELHRLAEDRAIDLIVVGSHGRHGLALLFGSITKGVVQNASCDVLAVRVQ